jgi:uncharacterized SAM-binding protein YcdF (DUF218 family)
MSHVVEFVIRPTVFLPLILALALVNLWRRRRETRGRLLFLTVPFGLLAVISLPAVAYLALGTLEWSYPTSTEIPGHPEMLVVLSGYMMAPKDKPDRAELGADTYYRCLHALRLYRKADGCPLLLSGGISEGARQGPPLADAMRTFFLQQGVKAADLTVENRSQTTYENAVNCAAMLQARGIHRIVLVTDAKHLWRASLCFAKQGIDVVPSPCSAFTERFENRLEDYVPSPDGAGHFMSAFHEWIGVVYYRLRGWI